jgi:hypothetical protein
VGGDDGAAPGAWVEGAVGGRITVGVVIIIIIIGGQFLLLFIMAFPPHLIIASSRGAAPSVAAERDGEAAAERRKREQAIFIMSDGERVSRLLRFLWVGRIGWRPRKASRSC